MSVNLNPEKALIFRIVHVENVPWILEHGMHCRSSEETDPNYVNIGNPELISARAHRRVRIAPGGTLSDYVPFYFTPFSIMMLNINTGYNGVKRRSNDEIVIFVSSLRRLDKQGIPFLFTDRHAYPVFAQYFDDLVHIDRIDWELLQARDFSHDPDDPGKKERYQAEALIHRHVPVDAFLGLGCHSRSVKGRLESELAERGIELDVKVTPKWYF